MKNAMRIYVSLLFLVLGLAVGVEGADLETGLVAHWKFDETEGTTAHDCSGNGLGAPVVGTAVWDRGIVGGSLDFDGSSTFVDVDADVLRGSFTYALWLYARNLPYATGYRAVMHTDAWTTGTPHVHLMASTSLFNLDVNGGIGISSTTVFEADRWYHVAVTYDYEAGNAEASIYVNGVLEATNTGPSAEPVISPFNIGAWLNGAERFYHGKMDDIRIYNRALSENEVVSLVANDAFWASFKANTWEDEDGEHTRIGLVFPWNGWRYALELSDTLYPQIWRRANPAFPGFDYDIYGGGGMKWEWTDDNGLRMWSIRVAVESRTPPFGELNVLVNPITRETGNQYLIISNVSDDSAVKAGFRPLGSRMFHGSADPTEPQRDDHATWMIKPSGSTEPGQRPPICEVVFAEDRGYGTWHLEPQESGYVALGDYHCNEGEGPPGEGSPYRPVAVRNDLVEWVGEENETLTAWLPIPGHYERIYTGKRPSQDPHPGDAKLLDPGRSYCDKCAHQHRYMLRLPLPQLVRPRRTAGELITFGPLSQPSDLSTVFTSHTLTVPYTEVKDPRPLHDRNWQLFFSPFYTLEREEGFQLMQTATGEGTFQYTDTQGTSTEVANSYWQSSSFTVDLDVGIQVKAVDISGGISVTTEMGWESSQAFSNMREKSVSYSATVRSGEFAGLWFRCYRLLQRDALGQAVDPNPEWMVDPNEAVFTYWPPR